MAPSIQYNLSSLCFLRNQRYRSDLFDPEVQSLQRFQPILSPQRFQPPRLLLLDLQRPDLLVVPSHYRLRLELPWRLTRLQFPTPWRLR